MLRCRGPPHNVRWARRLLKRLMQIVLTFNPTSGKGHARENVKLIAEALEATSHRIRVVETEPSDAKIWLLPKLADCDLLLVFGGDGTVLLVLDAVLDAGVPIFHVPEGTENLFARGFGMSANPERVAAAVSRFKQVKMDVGKANGQRFLLMASLGFDAEVVHDLAARRRGPISHLSYVGPMLRQFFKWKPPRLSVVIDGQDLLAESIADCGGQENGQTNEQGSPLSVTGRRGFVIVANSRCYALGLNPAPSASMIDGQLDVIFVPVKRSWSVLWFFLLGMLGCLHRSSRVCVGKGRCIQVCATCSQHVQLDGDPATETDSGKNQGNQHAWQLNVSVEAGALSVVVPLEADTLPI